MSNTKLKQINQYSQRIEDFERRNYNIFEENNQQKLVIQNGKKFMKQSQSGKAGLELFQPFKKNDFKKYLSFDYSTKSNIPLFKTKSSKENREYLEKRHFETVEKIAEMRHQKYSSMISKPNLSVNSIKICERLSDKLDKTFYRTVNNSRTKDLEEISSREYICNLIKKSSSTSKRSLGKIANSNSSSVHETINKVNTSNRNVHQSRNFITSNIYKTTQEITPITMKNTSSSFINKSYLNQNKRMNELRYIKDYLNNFEEKPELENEACVKQFNSINIVNSIPESIINCQRNSSKISLV